MTADWDSPGVAFADGSDDDGFAPSGASDDRLPDRARRAYIALLTNRYVSRARNRTAWEGLLAYQREIEARLDEMFLDLFVDRDAEVAFKRQQGGDDIPRLLRREKPLTRDASFAQLQGIVATRFDLRWVVGGRRADPAVDRRVMDLLASGLGPMDVARATGVARSKIYRMHHRVGGVYRPANQTYSARYLSRQERYEIARLHDAGVCDADIAGRLGRHKSTIGRERRRNARATGNYEPEHADRVAWERQRRPKPSKLSTLPRLRDRVQQLLDKRYSPEQVSGRLKLLHPDDPTLNISHETIYQSLYVYPRGALKRELKAHLRRGRVLRQRRGRAERRGHIRDAVSIHERPEEIESRLVPGHHEGDLIMGSTASNSAIGTIVERTTGLVTLLHLPDGHTADKVADAIIDQMSALPPWFAKTLTWDRGTEMAAHATVTARTRIQVYFADPYSPYQRGSNENTNGLLREYLPKGSDLSVHTRAELRAIADELNDRPRKRLGYHTPNEAFANLLQQQQSTVATTP